jgi:hypothetical protein
MDNKNLSVEERVKSLIESFKDRTPKQMRTIRNNLNNRIRSFEEEMKYGKTLPKVSASHMFYEFDLKDCKKVLEAAMKQLKTLK